MRQIHAPAHAGLPAVSRLGIPGDCRGKSLREKRQPTGRVPGRETGYFFAPTVVEASSNSTDLCQKELFGPFAMVQRVSGLAEALAIANDSEFGLASYVWSNDLPSVMKARREIRAGTVWVNTPMTRDLRSPFGGYKQSGIGRDGLPGSIELFTEEKTTLIPQDPLMLPRMGSN